MSAINSSGRPNPQDELKENPIIELLWHEFYRKHVLEGEGGCYMPMPFPTGVGKTHNTLTLLIYIVLDEIERERLAGDAYVPRYCYYITNSVDNVRSAYEDLLTRINESKYLSKEQKKLLVDRVLYAPSNSFSLLKLMCEAPDKLKEISDVFSVQKNTSLSKQLEDLSKEQLLLKINIPSEQRKTLTDRIQKQASECYRALVLHIQKIQLGDQPVPLTSKHIELLSELIPGVKVEAGLARVVFMTTKKFLFGLQQSKGKFHPTRHLHGNVLLIDEVDRQHHEILTHLVGQNDTDLLATLRTVHSNLKEHRLCSKPQYKGIDLKFEEYLTKVKTFFDRWSLQYSFDLDSGVVRDKKPVLLFSDKLATHITSVNGRLAVSFNENFKQHDIAVRGTYKDREEQDFPKLLGELERLVNRTFHSLVRDAEELYRKNMEGILSPHEFRQLTSAQAIASILDQLNLHSLRHQLSQQLNYLVGRQYSPRKSAANYHTRGIRLIEVDRLPEAKDSVMFKHHGFNVTPSGMLASWAESGCCVLGISATAECESVLHNFDIGYLRASLGARFVELSRNLRQLIHQYYESERDYKGKEIKIIPTKIDSDLVFIKDLLGQWNPKARNPHIMYQQLFGPETKDVDYGLKWLSKVCRAIEGFIKTPSNRYMFAMLNRTIKQDIAHFLKWYVGDLEQDLKVSVRLFSKINADFLKEKFKNDVIGHLESSPGKVIALTTYQTMSSGKNPSYKFNPKFEDNTLRHVGHRSNDTTDIDFLYLEAPTNLLSVDGKPENVTSDRLLLLSYAMALQEIGAITPSEANSWAHQTVTHNGLKQLSNNLKGKFYKKDSGDCLHAICRMIEQAVGRTARTEMKREEIYLTADSELLEILSNDERENVLFSHEYKALLAYAKSEFAWLNPPVDRESRRRQNLAKLHTVRSHGAIQRMLNRINGQPDEEVIESWHQLREMVLTDPVVLTPPVNDEYYLTPPGRGGYEYSFPSEEWKIDEYRFFDLATVSTRYVSETHSRLSLLISNLAVKNWFEAKGYATQWQANAPYVMTPPIYTNIYLGALGEEAGKAILESQSFEIKPMPTEHFEQFDGILCFEGREALIDFKHWDLNAWRSLSDEIRHQTMEHFSKKLAGLGLNKLVICNLLKESNEPILYFDKQFNAVSAPELASIVCIPNLLNSEDGTTDLDVIRALISWMDS